MSNTNGCEPRVILGCMFRHHSIRKECSQCTAPKPQANKTDDMSKLTNKEAEMSKQETITLNGKVYMEIDPNKKDIQPAVETDHVIIIAQRGWIFEGYADKSVTDKIQLLNANVVRSWSNNKGIGGLCKKTFKEDYTLDEAGTVSFPIEGVICTLNITEW